MKDFLTAVGYILRFVFGLLLCIYSIFWFLIANIISIYYFWVHNAPIDSILKLLSLPLPIVIIPITGVVAIACFAVGSTWVKGEKILEQDN